jgi:Flp pilus assembly protein TadB
VEPVPSRATERRRLQEAVAARRRRTSIFAGVLGLALLFAGGVGVIVSPLTSLALIVLMSTGIVFLLVAFFLARNAIVGLPRKPRNR